MKYTEEMKQFILDNYKGASNAELTERFNSKFGTKVSLGQMKSYKGNHGLNSGLTGKFEKGHIPQNKGKKMSAEMYEKVKHTMFKKGHIPQNHRPVGSERVNVDGYIEVKVKGPNIWELKHRLVWERANGVIPKEAGIIFLDGNKLNCSIDNLRCVTRAELLYLNRHGLNNAGEVTDTGILMARLDSARNKRKRLNNKEEL